MAVEGVAGSTVSSGVSMSSTAMRAGLTANSRARQQCANRVASRSLSAGCVTLR